MAHRRKDGAAPHTAVWRVSAEDGDRRVYPDNSHVGIVGGRNANGELLIIHCASGYNNVVVTRLGGFTSIGRPQYYAEAGHS